VLSSEPDTTLHSAVSGPGHIPGPLVFCQLLDMLYHIVYSRATSKCYRRLHGKTFTIALTDTRGRVQKYERKNYTDPIEALTAARKLSESWPVERIRIHVSYNQLYKLDDFERKVKQ
jgi:hypothetical protein